MTTAIPPDERTRIADACRQAATTGESRNSIARRFHRAPSTITNIAQAAGLDAAFDRSRTKRGTEAARVDARAARQRLADGLLHDAQVIRQALTSGAILFAQGRPGPGEIKNLAIAFKVLVDAHAQLIGLEPDTAAGSQLELFIGYLVGDLVPASPEAENRYRAAVVGR